MDRPLRILIASASAGTGHLHAAEALGQALLEWDPDTHIRHVDVLQLAPTWLRRAYGDGFEFMAARAPRLWKELYFRTDGEVDTARWGAAAYRLLFHPFQQMLDGEAWDLVLCTHFLPCQLAAGRPGAPPFALVLTDFALHRFWVQQRVSRFFVATNALAGELRRRVHGARIDATGIPIDPRFLDSLPRAAARKELGLDIDRPVALVMGGGMGIGVVESTRAAAAADVPDLQILAVTGKSEHARQALAPLAAADPRVRVFGRVDRVQRFMAAADVVVTKPGGLTTSEALALGRPLVLSRAIPGHEEGNALTLAGLGAALNAPSPTNIREALEQLFGDPDLLSRTAESARRIGRPHAAQTIAGSVQREYLLQLAG